MGVATWKLPVWLFQEPSGCRPGLHISASGRLASRPIHQIIQHLCVLRSRRCLTPPARSTKGFTLFGVISTISPSGTTDFKEATGDLMEAEQVAKLSSSSGQRHYIVNG